MNPRLGPLGQGVLLGAALLAGYYLLSGLLSAAMMNRLLASPLMDPANLSDPTFGPDPADSLGSLFGAGAGWMAWLLAGNGFLGCLAWLGAGLASGAFYARQRHRQAPLTEAPLRGGAAAGALAYVIGTLLGSLLSLLLVRSQLQSLLSLILETARTEGGAPPLVRSQFFTVWGVVMGVGLLCSTLFWAGFGAGLGALGSALGLAYASR